MGRAVVENVQGNKEEKDMPKNNLYRATCVWFDAKKGYGFLHSDDLPNDVFVHFRQILCESEYRSLNQGQLVEFEVANVPRGIEARNVRVIEETVVL
jgi:CspA family cold shock protein